MNEQTTALLERLATNLGTTVEYLWEVTVAYAPVWGISKIIEILLLAVAVSVCLKLAPFMFAKDKEQRHVYDDYSGYYFCGIILSATGVILSGAFIVHLIANLTPIITAFTNPEYWAMEHILNKLRYLR